MTFVDDYICKVWVFFLKRKNKTLEQFKIFREFIERLTRHPIKVLCSNCGR
jgi:hypothetical protein